jgi:hypothetical protein
LEWFTVEQDREPVEVASVAKVEAAGRLSAAVGVGMADQVQLIGLEDQVVVEYGRAPRSGVNLARTPGIISVPGVGVNPVRLRWTRVQAR